MKIPVSFGGGGGSGSDDCTATAADILKSKTAIYSGTDDEPENGSMEDYSGTTKTATPALDSSSSQMTFAIPNTGKYDTAAKLASTYATIRSLIGLTDASKFLAGTTILGLAGTMTNRSNTTQTATASINGSNIRMQIPNTGYYDTTSYVQTSYSNIASLVGLTAAKIKYGETIMGITGTWNGYVATTTDLYYGGSVGTVGGSLGTYSGDNCTVKSDTSCIVLTSVPYTAIGSSNFAGVSFGTAINCGAYSTLTMTFNESQNPTQTSSTGSHNLYLGLYTSRPTTRDGFADPAYSASFSPRTSTSSGNTISIDISGISQSLYVGVYINGSYANSNMGWQAEITRIQLS